MFKLAVVIFCAMTFGYAFGRIQQFNIDDLIPVLFIVEKYDEQEKRTYNNQIYSDNQWRLDKK